MRPRRPSDFSRETFRPQTPEETRKEAAVLCVSLMPETTDRAREGLIRAVRAADPSKGPSNVLAEIRLDAMREFDLAHLLADSPCPVIVTYRPRREGGLYDGPEGKRLETLRQAARLGARYIDVEHDALRSLGDVPPDRVIVSYHNFERTPEDLAAIHARLARMGAAVVKVAVTANHILDTVPVLRLLKEATVPTIALAMGERGILTRILAPKFGGFLTYAAAEGGGREAGPGQVTVGEMCNLYRVGRIGPDTQVYGVIADPVGHSLSPRIHNAAFAETDLDAVYLPLWVEGDAAEFVSGVREFDFDGYSVTIPHKQGVRRGPHHHRHRPEAGQGPRRRTRRCLKSVIPSAAQRSRGISPCAACHGEARRAKTGCRSEFTRRGGHSALRTGLRRCSQLLSRRHAPERGRITPPQGMPAERHGRLRRRL